jgi:hypothetical protein
MRSIKTILLGLAIPAVCLLAGVGFATPAASAPIHFPGPTCANVLCPAGTTCVDSKDGPRCVPLPGPIAWP